MRRWLLTGILVATFAAASACTTESPETDSPSSAANEATETPAVNESTEVTTELEFDPNDAMTFFDTLTVPYIGREWEIISPSDQADYFVQLVNYASCTESMPNKCPRLTFERLDAIPSDRITDVATADDPAFALAHAWCAVGNDGLREIIETEEVLIGGKTASHLSLDQCPLDIYQEPFTWYPRDIWYVDDILISAEASVGGTLDEQTLAALVQAEWL
jgi:hypothetical protein